MCDWFLRHGQKIWDYNSIIFQETLSKTKFEDLMDKLEKGSGCEVCVYLTLGQPNYFL